MKKSTRIGLMIAGICIGLGIIFAVTGILTGAKSGVSLGLDGLHILDDERYTYESERVKGIKDIKLSVDNAALEFLTSEDDTFRVSIDLWSSHNKPEVRIEGALISVTQSPDFSWNFLQFDFVNWIKYIGTENKVTVYVPKDASLDQIDVRTSNGRIEIDTDLSVNTLKADTSNGAILLSEVECTDYADIHTSNGKIQCNGTFSGKTELKTSNGKIELAGTYLGGIRCKTSNGAVDADFDGLKRDYNLEAHTSNGNVRIDGNKMGDDYSEDNRAQNDLDIKTSNGSITITFSER